MLLTVTAAYATEVVIGSNSTNVGTIVFVSPTPGDSAQANGTALLNTLAGITADASNPYLIRLGPGIYDLGTCDTSGTPPFSCVLYLKEYIDIEGSGENTTKITGSMDGGATSPPVAGTVMGADNAEIRFLTIENTSTGYARAIFNLNASPSILNVTATGSGGTNNYGVTNNSSAPRLTNVTAKASGGAVSQGVLNSSSAPIMTNVTATGKDGTTNYGVRNVQTSSPEMTNVIATASGGTNNYGVFSGNSSSVKISHSVIQGTTAISNGSGVTTLLAYTQLDG
ncbi:MAG TPA: hypothetical protein VJ508_16460, partial [Saprospiraceae bacterium]|nr:hypothetical protein [Saprospiraceae bacterium]